MRARHTRTARMLRAGASSLLLVAVLGAAAQGAEGERLVFGFVTGSEATPIALEYNQPSFGVPATPTFEIRFFHSETQSDSGPSSHGLASVVWPGDLAGNAPPQLAYDQFVVPYIKPIVDEMPQQFQDGFWQASDGVREGLGDAPPYPVRAEEFHPPQPRDDGSTQIGAGIGMTARARDGLAEARASGNRAGFPAIFEAGNLNSNAFSGIRDGIGAAEAATEIADLSIFDGIFHIESFTNAMTVTSDGHEAKLSSSLKLGGFTVTYPDGDSTTTVEIISIDENGVVIGGEQGGGFTWDEAQGYFDEYFAPNGLTIKLVQADEELNGASGQRAVTALKITMDGRYLAQMRNQFPEPVRSWLVSPAESPLGPVYAAFPESAAGTVDSLIQFDQSMTLVLGNVEVNGAASPPFVLPPPPAQPPIIIQGEAPPPITVTQQVEVPGPPVDRPVPVIGGVPVAVGVTGVPVGLATFGAILALMGALALRTLADRATAKAALAAAADRCDDLE